MDEDHGFAGRVVPERSRDRPVHFPEGPGDLAGRLREQALHCDRLGSPLYATLLSRAANDLEAGGPIGAVLDPFASEPAGSALALRFMAAVHRLVLAGGAEDLAAHYPSAGGDGDQEAAWRAFRRLSADRGDEVRELTRRSCQTNEVGRSAALLGGFLEVVWETGRPLALLEIGTSAGLNLRWDRFRYEGDGWAWGDPASPVRIAGAFAEGRPPVDVEVSVLSRRGCDPDPVDPTTEDGRVTLRSSVWADQTDRFERLDGALAIAARVAAEVDRSGAARWLPERLAGRPSGAATVVFHSIVLQYLGQADRERTIASIEEAGAGATAEAPLAWLRMEPAGTYADVRLTLWPGGEERLLATTGYHGREVRWLPS